MNNGFYGFPNILGVLRATSVKVLGKTGATAGCALAGATTSGAPTAGGPFDVGDMVVGQNGTLWICTTAGISQSSPGSFTQVAGTSSPLSTKGDVWVYGSADARLGVGSNDAVLIADSTQTLGLRWGAAPAGAGGALTQIAQTVLGGAAASITFASIPGSYSSLWLHYQVRGDAAQSNVNLLVQFNSDTAAHYNAQYVLGAGSSATAAESIGQTSLIAGSAAAATGTANFADCGAILIPNYGGTSFVKHTISGHGLNYDALSTDIYSYHRYGLWNSTAAITSVKIFPNTGNFVANSVVTVYGLS